MVIILVVNDESFFNIVGEEISRSGLVEQMIDYYNQKLEFGETKVTDFNEGSEIRNLLESIAVDLYSLMEDNYEVSKIAFIQTAYGEWLDLHGANPLINLERNQGAEAVGVVTFSIPDVVTGDIYIPESTVILSSETDLEYITSEETTIIAGSTSADCFVTCLTVGSDGNSSSNTLTIIDDNNIDNSITVNNAEAITGGEDYEDDESYRQRLLNFIRKDTFGSIGYYEDLGKSIEGVHDIILDTSVSPIVVTVNGNEKPVSDVVLANVLTEFTDTNNIVLGHNFTVESVTYTTIGTGFVININTQQLINEEDITELLTAIFDGGVTTNNFGYDGLSIGESLSYITLINEFLNNFDEITNVTFTLNGNAFENLSPANQNKVLKINTNQITINQTLGE